MGVTGQHHASIAIYPREKVPGTHWTGGWEGLRAGLDTEAGGKILASTGDGILVTQFVVRLYNSYKIIFKCFSLFLYIRVSSNLCFFVIHIRPSVGALSSELCSLFSELLCRLPTVYRLRLSVPAEQQTWAISSSCFPMVTAAAEHSQ
jgi:hypothetical protein